MERRKFTREFKLEAVRLIKHRGVSYVQAAGLSLAKGCNYMLSTPLNTAGFPNTRMPLCPR